MGFLNARSIRIPLALVGGALYGLLTDALCRVIGRSSNVGIALGSPSFSFISFRGSFFCSLGSTPVTLQARKGRPRGTLRKTVVSIGPANGVGNSITIMNIALLLALSLICMVCLVWFGIEGVQGKPFGETLQHLFRPRQERIL